MRRTLITLFVSLAASGCAVQSDTVSSDEQDVCNENRDSCPGGHPITDSELRGETRRRYGSPIGKLSCSAIHVEPGNHYTSCEVSIGDTKLFHCTFGYSVNPNGDTTITSTDCNVG